MIGNNQLVKQLGSYLIVGILATIVEWASYYIFDNDLHFNVYVAVALAFVFSTFANWLFGRLLTFRNVNYKGGHIKEIAAIYGASVIGLILNEIIMWIILVLVISNATSTQRMLSKIVATGIVFFWNFFIRRFVIYK